MKVRDIREFFAKHQEQSQDTCYLCGGYTTSGLTEFYRTYSHLRHCEFEKVMAIVVRNGLANRSDDEDLN
jgi:hypothetical protein